MGRGLGHAAGAGGVRETVSAGQARPYRGQNLSQHVHLHCLIPGGALNPDGQWKPAKGHYLFPVRALSRVFRGKMVSALRVAAQHGELHRITRLGLTGALHHSLRTTNLIESINSSIETYTRNVKRWRGDVMAQRWVSAALLDAKIRLRRVRWLKVTCPGSSPHWMPAHRGLPKPRGSPRIHDHGVRRLPKFNSGWDNPVGFVLVKLGCLRPSFIHLTRV